MSSSFDLPKFEELPRRRSAAEDDYISDSEHKQAFCTTIGAQGTALGIYEIFDMILDRLPPGDLLMLQLTGKSVRDHILNSSVLQRKLGFSAIPRPVHSPTKATRFISKRPDFVHEFVSINGLRYGLIAIPDLPDDESTAHESWRRMIPFQPAPKAIVMHYRGEDLIIIPRSTQFVTLGMLYEVGQKHFWRRTHTPNARTAFEAEPHDVQQAACKAAWILDLKLPTGVFHYPQDDQAVARMMARPDITVQYLKTCVVYSAPWSAEYPREQLTDGAGYFQATYEYNDGCVTAYKSSSG